MSATAESQDNLPGKCDAKSFEKGCSVLSSEATYTVEPSFVYKEGTDILLHRTDNFICRSVTSLQDQRIEH